MSSNVSRMFAAGVPDRDAINALATVVGRIESLDKDRDERLEKLEVAIMKELLPLAKEVREAIGEWPDASVNVDAELRAMQLESLRDMTAEEAVQREAKIKADLLRRKGGSGMRAHIAGLTASDAIQSAKIAQRGVMVKAGGAIGTLAAMAGLVQSLGGPEGIATIVRAFTGAP